jgi:hypothetical protein
MPVQTSFEIRVYSPRWGREEIYVINLDAQRMRIARGKRSAACSWVKGSGPKWLGKNQSLISPLVTILKNDWVYPPTVFARALKQSWMAWRIGTLDNQEVQEETRRDGESVTSLAT